jgi:hypothetical protein
MYKLLGQKGRKLGNKGCLPGNSGFFFFREGGDSGGAAAVAAAVSGDCEQWV